MKDQGSQSARSSGHELARLRGLPKMDSEQDSKD